MKMYVGIAKAVPDSLTPRRFTVIRKTVAPMASIASCPCNGGIAAAAYWDADEIDTATVST